MSSRGIKVGVASRVPSVRPCRLLRFLDGQARDQTLPRHASSRHACASTSKLDVVLPSRDHGKPWATHSRTEVNRIRLRSGATYQFVTISMMLACALVDRKSTRLNSSHRTISYAVFCLKKKRPS